MTRTTNIKKILRLVVLISLFAFIVGYSIFQTKALTKGVDLTLSGITDGEVLGSNTLTISGQAKHAKHISINDKELLVDKDENFSDDLILSPGYNIITVEAEDRFDKVTKNTYRIYYEKSGEVLTALNN